MHIKYLYKLGKYPILQKKQNSGYTHVFELELFNLRNFDLNWNFFYSKNYTKFRIYPSHFHEFSRFARCTTIF